MATTWYKRSGQRTTEKMVQEAKNSYARAKRIGLMGTLPCSIQPNVADRIDAMSLIEFANFSGQYTYRTDVQKRRARNAANRAKNQILRDVCGTSARAAREDMGL